MSIAKKIAGRHGVYERHWQTSSRPAYLDASRYSIYMNYVCKICMKGEISDRVFCFSFRSKVKIKSVSYFICLSLNKMWNAISFKKTCSAKRKNMSYGVIGEAMQWKMLKSILHILPSWYWYNVFKQANMIMIIYHFEGMPVCWWYEWENDVV